MNRAPAPRTAVLAEKTILGLIAGAAAAVAVLAVVFLVGRIVEVSTGPVTLHDVPTDGPIDAGFAGATFHSVDVTLDLSGDGRMFLIAGGVLSTLLTVGICLVLAWLCVRVLRGKPFGPSLTWGIGTVAILVVAAGLGGPLLEGMAAQQSALALGVEELPVFLVEVDLAPLAWGFALAVVAGAFEIGQRMQRDTQGLV